MTVTQLIDDLQAFVELPDITEVVVMDPEYGSLDPVVRVDPQPKHDYRSDKSTPLIELLMYPR